MDSQLILVRHGQSLFNLENRFTGWQDVDLSLLGEQEAVKVGLQLKSVKIDVVYTSVLLRAKHTYQIIKEIAGLQKLPLTETKALNERGYGNLEGLDKTETTAKFGAHQVHIWRRSFNVAPPRGESLKDTYDRVVPYFKGYIKKDLDKGLSVLIVAHGNSLRALMMYLEKLTPKEIANREIATGIPIFYHWPIQTPSE